MNKKSNFIHTVILSYTQSTRKQNLQKIIYDYEEAMHLWTTKCLIFKTEVELTLSHPCLKPSTSDDKLTITQVPSILSFLFTFFQVYYSTSIDSTGTVFSHIKVLFVFSSPSHSFVTDRSEDGNKKDEKVLTDFSTDRQRKPTQTNH